MATQEPPEPDSPKGEKSERPPLIGCGVNGCINGWRPPATKFGRWRKCSCRESYKRDMAGAVKVWLTKEHQKHVDWADVKRERGLPEELTAQQHWIDEHREELKQPAARLTMDMKPHPKAGELLKLRKQGITGKTAYKILDTSPSGVAYAEYFK